MASSSSVLLVMAVSAGLAAGACDPYEDFKDESLSLGPVDPVNFPAANLGAGGNRMRPGTGSFEEQSAWIGGQRVGYFRYAMPTGVQVMGGLPVVPASVARAFVFDSSEAQPVPDKNPCQPPAGWSPNPRLDEVSYEQQGNIFTALPSASYTPGAASTSTYLPVVAEAPISSNGQICQRFKSTKGLEKVFTPLPDPSGKLLAWLIIDPGAAVYPLDWLSLPPAEQAMMPHPGVGVQKWGWFNRYLLAYLDGGYIPVQQMDTVRLMRTQRIYLPRTPIMSGTMMMPAQLGQGLEVLTARRGDPAYSPVCEVMTYDVAAGMGMGMAVSPDMLPKDAAAITGNMPLAMTLMPATPRFVFCLQVR